MLMQRLRQHSSHSNTVYLNSRSLTPNIPRQRIHYRPAHAFPIHNLHTSSTQFKTTTTATIDPDGSAESLDKFREREEQREREFEQQKASEEAQSEDEAKRAKIDAIRAQILEAALPHVPTLGWSRNAIVKGAEEAGFPSVVHGMFPEGGYALVSYFYGKCNDELVSRLQEETKNGSLAVGDPLEFLVRAVRTRLEMVVPYKAQWSQALALIAMPQNAATSLAQVLTLVDDICYYAGDRSVDFGWYTRRIGLATIMKMTELFMLQDSSADHAKTWEFLKNRMDEAVQIQLVLSQTGGMTQNFTRSFNSAFITFGWYTRRIGLATIMKMTELFMLQDSSADHAKTWEFLKNRMDEAVQIQLVLSQTGGMTQNFTRSFNSAFITARNILGIDYTRR